MGKAVAALEHHALATRKLALAVANHAEATRKLALALPKQGPENTGKA